MHGSLKSRLFTGVLVGLVGLCFGRLQAADTAPVFIDIPKIRSVSGDGVYADILNYSVEPPFGDAHGRPTNAHETAHGIHASYRNKYHLETGKDINALYMRNGRIALVTEPPFLIRNVQAHLPQCLRGSRYKLYFVEQLRYWDAEPIYIFDEWTAYICGGETAVDDFERLGLGKHKDYVEDSVAGCLEFSVYAVAVYLTAKERAPEYLEQEPQFLAVLAYNLTRAETAFYAGRETFRNSAQERFYSALQSHPDAAPIRDCLRKEFDGAFLLKTDSEGKNK